MPHSIVINQKYYAAYVTVLEGQGDGPLIYITPDGHIHIDHNPGGPGDPGPLRARLESAFKTFQVGVNALISAAASAARKE